MAFIILNHCANIQWTEIEKKFRQEYWAVRDMEELGNELIYDINAVFRLRCNAYGDTWNIDDPLNAGKTILCFVNLTTRDVRNV